MTQLRSSRLFHASRDRGRSSSRSATRRAKKPSSLCHRDGARGRRGGVPGSGARAVPGRRGSGNPSPRRARGGRRAGSAVRCVEPIALVPRGATGSTDFGPSTGATRRRTTHRAGSSVTPGPPGAFAPMTSRPDRKAPRGPDSARPSPRDTSVTSDAPGPSVCGSESRPSGVRACSRPDDNGRGRPDPSGAAGPAMVGVGKPGPRAAETRAEDIARADATRGL